MKKTIQIDETAVARFRAICDLALRAAGLEAFDHVTYWNGLLSQAQDVPEDEEAEG